MNFTKYIILIVLSFQISFLSAGEIKTGNPERERSNKEAMSESTFKKFTKLQEMIADEKYVEARSGLMALLEKRLNSFEKANVNQYIGWVDSAEGKYVAAANRFQKALDSDALPNQAHFPMMLQKAQILCGAGEFQKGLNSLHDYYKVTDAINDRTFVLEANAYAQLKKYRKAIPILKKAISLAEKPNEQWNYLLYSLHVELSQFLQASKVLETLIVINPNKEEYWKRLSGAYFSLKKDDKALATLVVAEKNGMLEDEKNKLQLFKMYALLGVPHKAAKVLEKGLKNGVIKSSYKHWEDLGKLWFSAAEMDRALLAYDEASKLATDGKIDFQRAYIFFDKEDWKKASSALKSAIEKGGLKDKKIGTGYLLMGMSESELGNAASALIALRKASKYDGTKKHAIQWIDHLESEAKRARVQAENDKILGAAENFEETSE